MTAVLPGNAFVIFSTSSYHPFTIQCSYCCMLNLGLCSSTEMAHPQRICPCHRTREPCQIAHRSEAYLHHINLNGVSAKMSFEQPFPVNALVELITSQLPCIFIRFPLLISGPSRNRKNRDHGRSVVQLTHPNPSIFSEPEGSPTTIAPADVNGAAIAHLCPWRRTSNPCSSLSAQL